MTRKEQGHLYQAIANYIEENIDNGNFVSGYVIPSEMDLAKKFGVSRMTARRATTDLVDKGILYRVNGKGTIVSNNRFKRNDFFMGFTGSKEAKIQGVTAKLIGIYRKKATVELASKLCISVDDEVYLIKRLRYKQNKPFLLEYIYVSMNKFPGLDQYDLANNSFYKTLREVYETDIAYTNQEVTASISKSEEINKYLFNGKAGVIVTVINQSFDEKDNPNEFSYAHYNANYFVGRYRLSKNNGYIEIINP